MNTEGHSVAASAEASTAGPWSVVEVGRTDGGRAICDIRSPHQTFGPVAGYLWLEDARHIVRCVNERDALLSIVRRLTLATDEGDDQARGTHYIAKDGAIRCKGSFLALIEEARAAIAKATGSAA